MHSDGTYVGRAAPEIDIFEAQVANDEGEVSQSGQWAVCRCLKYFAETDAFLALQR